MRLQAPRGVAHALLAHDVAQQPACGEAPRSQGQRSHTSGSATSGRSSAPPRAAASTRRPLLSTARTSAGARPRRGTPAAKTRNGFCRLSRRRRRRSSRTTRAFSRSTAASLRPQSLASINSRLRRRASTPALVARASPPGAFSQIPACSAGSIACSGGRAAGRGTWRGRCGRARRAPRPR